MRGAVAAAALVAAAAAVAVALSQPKPIAPYDDDTCLSCLCSVLANGPCKASDDCAAPNGPCGPFQITKPYWADAGMPVQSGDNKFLPGAFQRCVAEPFCAVRTVRGHMSRGLTDFDKDKRITCIDLLIAHVNGFHFKGDITRVRHLPQLRICLNQRSGDSPPPTSTTQPGSHGDPRPGRGHPPSSRGSSSHPSGGNLPAATRFPPRGFPAQPAPAGSSTLYDGPRDPSESRVNPYATGEQPSRGEHYGGSYDSLNHRPSGRHSTNQIDKLYHDRNQGGNYSQGMGNVRPRDVFNRLRSDEDAGIN